MSLLFLYLIAEFEQSLQVYLCLACLRGSQDEEENNLVALRDSAVACINNSIVNNGTAQIDIKDLKGIAALLHLITLNKSCTSLSLICRVLFTLGGSDVKVAKYMKDDLKASSIIIVTLTYLVRDTCVPFPLGVGRGELCVQLLKIIFLFATVDIPDITDMVSKEKSTLTSAIQSPALDNEDREILTQLGIVIVEILNTLPLSVPNAIEIKMQVVSILIYMPPEYSHYILANGGIEPLMDLLDFQTKISMIDGMGNSSVDITPIVIILNIIASSSPKACEIIKAHIFPPHRFIFLLFLFYLVS
jgi:hypothetical protein